jgi:hypothetical protein
MAPACQLLNPVQQEARGLRQKEEDKREKGIARLALQAPIDKKKLRLESCEIGMPSLKKSRRKK